MVEPGDVTAAVEQGVDLAERQADGRWRTYRPDGTEILLAEPVMAAI